MAIKEFITLEGVQEIEAQLKKLAATGEQSLEQFRKPLPDMKLPDIDAKPIEDATGHVLKLNEAFHALKPILQAAGLQLGEFGAFARVASNSMLAFGVAVSGAVIVGLAKLEENAARTKGQLTDLFGSSEKGDKAFDALGKQAKQFGTTVDNLAPGLEAFQTALNAVNRTATGFVALRAEDLPGAQIAKDADAVSGAYGNFIKLLRAGRLTQDEAEKSAKAFFDTLKEGGSVTSAALKNLPVGTINLLKDALGAAGLTTQAFFQAVDSGSISVDKLQQALLAFGPQAQKAFDTKAIKTFSDEIGRLLASLNKGFEGLTGKAFSEFVIGEIRRVRQGIEDSIEEFKKVAELIGRVEKATEIPGLGTLVSGQKTSTQGFDEAGFIAAGNKAGEDAGKAFNEGFLKSGFVFATNTLQQLGAAGVNAGAQTSKAMDQASASIQNLRDKAKETGKELDDIVIGSTRFKGRLDQIPVFEPQLAGETAATPGKAAGAKFVEAAQSEMTKLTIPQEAQQNLEQGLTQVGTQAADNFNTAFQASIPQTLTIAQAIYEGFKAIFSTPIPVSFDARSPLQSTAPFASGGMVHGRGSTTSDSILALLSNREFVVNARAVTHYGPDLFAALNAMRLPRDFINRFSMGGLARSLGGNRFAAGGQVRSGNPVVLNIDRQSFNMTAGDDTIAQLKRFAVTAQLSSTGRKPRWVR